MDSSTYPGDVSIPIADCRVTEIVPVDATTHVLAPVDTSEGAVTLHAGRRYSIAIPFPPHDPRPAPPIE